MEVFGCRGGDAVSGSWSVGSGRAGLFSKHSPARTVLGAVEEPRRCDARVTVCAATTRGL